MPPVYSSRLLHGRGSSATQQLVVPAGHRCVVRFCSVICFTSEPSFVAIWAHEVPLVWLLSPSVNSIRHYDVRAVVYAGESIVVNTGAGDVTWHVSGFIFRDA